jgi:hypothetical protein
MKRCSNFLVAAVTAFAFQGFCTCVQAAVYLTCDEDIFDEKSNKISVCISCEKSLTPEASVFHAAEKFNGAVQQCFALSAEIRGEIKSGDDQYFSAAVDLLQEKRDDIELEVNSSGFTIDSPGGDVVVAMKLADLFYKKRIELLNVERCYSACPIAISGARFRAYHPDRYDIRVHRLFPASPSAETDFDSWAEKERSYYDLITVFLEKYGVSRAIVDRMKVTPSSDTLRLGLKELEQLGLGKYNVRFAEELRFEITKNCGPARYEEYRLSPELLIDECAPTLK